MSDECRVPITIAAKSCSALAFFVIGALLPALGCCSDAGHEVQKARMSFGLIADVQYADQEPRGRRHYREAIDKLEECVADLNARDLDFTIQVGDIIDRGEESFDRVLPVFNRLKTRKYHVLGNHDFPVARDEVLAKLGLDSAYYSFPHAGWRFVVLDAQDLGVEYGWPEDSENYRRGAEMLERLRREEAVNAESWNGGIGPEQKRWLRDTLREASGKGEKSIIFCHMPLLAAACTPIHLLWNHEEIVEVLESSGAVVACFSGHDHGGGYAQRNGIHYVTVQGMVEAPKENAYAVVDLYDDRIEIRGVGKVTIRSLQCEGGRGP